MSQNQMNKEHSSVIAKLPIDVRIQRQSTVNPSTGCWEWNGQKNQNGYGLFSIKRKTYLAHRISYETFIGPIPAGDHRGTMCVCHTCDNRACVNPNHLFLASQLENVNDMYAKGRANAVGPKGSAHGAAKLNEADVLSMRRLAKKGWKQADIAERFGVAFQTVSKILRGERWVHV